MTTRIGDTSAARILCEAYNPIGAHSCRNARPTQHVGMVAASLLSLALAAPPIDAPRYADRFAYVEVELASNSGEAIAFDRGGTVVGMIRTWIDGDGDIWISSEYDDGFADIEIVGGQISMYGELPDLELASRAEAIRSLLDRMPGGILGPDAIAERNNWWRCGRWVAGAAIACYTANPLGCVGGSIQAACTCVPKLVKEFEHMECPWN